MKVVKHKITGRLVYREIPDFEEGKGIINAILFGFGSKSEFEEIEVTQEEWDAELLLRQQEEPLSMSDHIGKLKAINPALVKPATITRRFLGKNYDIDCLVTQSVKDLYLAGQIQIGDYVVVSFIEETPNTEERQVAIVTDKVYQSW